MDGDTDDVLCCKFKAKCSSLYTTGMCASNVRTDNLGAANAQAILAWMVTSMMHCAASSRPNAIAFTSVGCVYLAHNRAVLQQRGQHENSMHGCLDVFCGVSISPHGE